MATLDTSGCSVIKFQADTIVTLNALAFTYTAGSVIRVTDYNSLTVDNTTAVACMTSDGTQAFSPAFHREAVV